MNNEQKDFFNDNGYLIFDTKISHDLIEKIIATISYPNTTRIQDAWTRNPYVKTLALYPTIIDTITELYNKTPLPFQTLNFKVGTEQRIHSDTIHFNSEPKGNMCGVWVALEDITENNGPLFFYPGSHKEQELTYSDLAIDGLGPEQYPSYELKVQQYIDRKSCTKNYGLMPKGYAIIWAANLLHGGSQIVDPNSTRHSQVTHYFFESKYYYTPMMSNHEYIQYRNPKWIK